jgi:hypothetical protein
MPGYSLHQLDQRSVAVELPFPDETRVVRGHGRLIAAEPAGAAALHVVVEGPAEDFEFIFDIEQFSGSIVHGAPFACDFAIRLEQPLIRTAAA